MRSPRDVCLKGVSVSVFSRRCLNRLCAMNGTYVRCVGVNVAMANHATPRRIHAWIYVRVGLCVVRDRSVGWVNASKIHACRLAARRAWFAMGSAVCPTHVYRSTAASASSAGRGCVPRVLPLAAPCWLCRRSMRSRSMWWLKLSRRRSLYRWRMLKILAPQSRVLRAKFVRTVGTTWTAAHRLIVHRARHASQVPKASHSASTMIDPTTQCLMISFKPTKTGRVINQVPGLSITIDQPIKP